MASIAGPTAVAFYTIIHLRARNLRLIGAAVRCNFRTRAKLHRRRASECPNVPVYTPRTPSLALHILSLSLSLSVSSPYLSLLRALSLSLEVTRDRAPGAGGHVPGCRYHEKRMSIARSHSSGKREAAASADFTKLSPLCRPCMPGEKKTSTEKKTRAMVEPFTFR